MGYSMPSPMVSCCLLRDHGKLFEYIYITGRVPVGKLHTCTSSFTSEKILVLVLFIVGQFNGNDRSVYNKLAIDTSMFTMQEGKFQ